MSAELSPYHPVESSLQQAEPYSGIDDLVKIDVYDRGHRPDGKFLSTYEMGQIESHQDTIRQGITELASTISKPEQGVPETPEGIVQKEINLLSAEMPVPDIDAGDDSPDRRAKMISFFDRRKDQLTQFGDSVNMVFQKFFGKDIGGVEISGQEWLKARFHPTQLKHNFKANVATTSGRERPIYDRVVDNPVLRKAFYRRALAGDVFAENYLRRHDAKFGQREMTLFEAAKETATILSGLAAVRKIGRYALAGVTVGQLYFAQESVRTQERIDRLTKIADAERYHIGSAKFERERAAYKALTRKPGTYTRTFKGPRQTQTLPVHGTRLGN